MDTISKLKNKILVEKDGMKFIKIDKNKFNLSFCIENSNIHLEPIINFELIKLIYELNPDIYEKVILHKNSEDEGSIILLMKHFFNDLGFPQKFSYIDLKKTITGNIIHFDGASNFSNKPIEIPADVELLPINQINMECALVTPHKACFNCIILFHDSLIIPAFVEKVMGIIVNKIFNRVKKFIEAIKI